MMWKRVATAAVLMPVAIALVLWGSTTVVAAAVAALTTIALWEYFALGEAIGHRAYRVWTVICAVLLIFHGLALAAYGLLVSTVTSGGSALVHETPQRLFAYHGHHLLAVLYSPAALFFLFVMGLATLTLWTRRPLVEAIPSAGISCSAMLLIAFPLSFAPLLHAVPTIGPKFLLFACGITWAGDTVAYFVGRAFGKHLLAPKLSPKKTWEGSVGSMVGSLAVAYAFSYWIKIPVGHLLAMGAIGNVAGQMGDLLESAYKRSAGVKDSGGLLPGHGGILDRIDALILCIPVIWYYLVLVNPRVMR